MDKALFGDNDVAHSGGRRRGGAKPHPKPHETLLTIDRIGHRGDGIAQTETGSVYIPHVLPGERVRATMEGNRAVRCEILTPSPDRAEPFCLHFATCGGCTAQHMTELAYRAWKQGIVETALRNRGLDCAVDPMIDAHGAGRRRATFHALRVGGRWAVGFNAARSHRIVDLDTCPILTPNLAATPALIREIAELAGGNARFDAQLTDTDSGIDVGLIGIARLDLQLRMGLADIANRRKLARIAVEDEVVAAPHAPHIAMGRASVAIPPRTFLQATAAGEKTLAELVCNALKGSRRVADLFAGVGPFALRLAEDVPVDAADSDAPAIAALTQATKTTPRLKPIKAEVRDLFTRPFVGPELARYDGVVFDPPRAGAEAQARALASSAITTVVAVSCDPATFARDAAILVSGGYRPERVSPVDQFKWSPHIEIVALFRRRQMAT